MAATAVVVAAAVDTAAEVSVAVAMPVAVLNVAALPAEADKVEQGAADSLAEAAGISRTQGHRAAAATAGLRIAAALRVAAPAADS